MRRLSRMRQTGMLTLGFVAALGLVLLMISSGSAEEDAGGGAGATEVAATCANMRTHHASHTAVMGNTECDLVLVVSGPFMTGMPNRAHGADDTHGFHGNGAVHQHDADDMSRTMKHGHEHPMDTRDCHDMMRMPEADRTPTGASTADVAPAAQ